MQHSSRIIFTGLLPDGFRTTFVAVFFDHLWRPLYAADTYRGMLDMAANLKRQRIYRHRLYCVVSSSAIQGDTCYTLRVVKYAVENDGIFRCLSRDIIEEDQVLTGLQFLVDEERDRRNSDDPLPVTLRLFADGVPIAFPMGWVATDLLVVELDRNILFLARESNHVCMRDYNYCQIYQIRNFTLNTPPLHLAITEQEYKDKVMHEEQLFYNYISTHKEPHSSTDHVWKYIIKPMLDVPMNYLVYASKPPSRKRKAN